MQSDAKSARAKVVPIRAEGPLSAVERAKLARLPAPVHAVQEKGKQLFSKALRSLFDNADDALFGLADKATSNQDQNLYFESMREVRIRRRELESKFTEAIDAAFLGLVLKEDNRDLKISADSLSLVDDDELEELVAIDSMIAKANKSSGESLQYLSLRLDSLVPNKVYQKTNPLGPDVICDGFVSAARSLDADIKAKLILFKLFDQYVITELPAIYDRLNATLIEHNVLPSLQHQKADSQGGAPPSRGAANSSAGSANAARGGARPDGQAAIAEGGAVYISGNALMSALTLIQGSQTAQPQGDADSPSGPPTDISALLLKALKEEHGPRTLDRAQRETINLVKLLFEFILDDSTLAEPMKALIGRLQIPILKVALLDESFFNKRGHPARRLLNEMATASLGWQENPRDEGAPKDPLYQKISELVHGLLRNFETDVSLFNDVLADFVSFVDKERKRASILERRTIDAEDGKARAEAARHEVNESLAELTAGQPIPADAEKILNEAWSNVLFLVSLKQGRGSEEWQQALQTADDLIWSVTAPITPETRQQLLGMIPHLVKRLREGLERIAFNHFEMTQLLNRLEKLHLGRLQPGHASAQPAADPEEAAANDAAGPQESSVTSIDESKDIDDHYLELINKLTQGTWFEMIEGNGKSYRCRLAAIITPADKYIFVNRSGMKVAEKTRDSLALAMQEGKLRLLDDTMLFDRALESVIGDLRKPR